MINVLYKLNINKQKLILILIILLFAIVVPITIIQVQRQQTTKTKATSPDEYNAFNVTDNNGTPLEYKDENSLRTYETKSLDVKVKVNDLERLTNE